MHTDDKVDNQSNDSATSLDSGVITDEKFMSDTNQRSNNIGISTSISSDNSTPIDTSINIDNIINLAKNVSPSARKANATPPHSKSSPTFSIRSTNISITSIHSDAVSSVIDSDTDDFEDSNGNYTIKKLGKQTSCSPGGVDIPNIGGSDALVLLQQRIDGGRLGPLATVSDAGGPQVSSMAFTNSTDITIGQKNYYQGPVTIQQFLIETQKREGVSTSSASSGGNVNPAFENGSVREAGERRKPDDQEASKPNDVQHRSQPYKFIFNRRAAIITAAIIILTIVLGVVFVTSSSVLKRKNLDIIGAGKVLRLVPRDEWLATPASDPLDPLALPVHRVVIAHTATESCATQAECTYRTRVIQDFHMKSRGYSDIAYNFLVGGDGCVYEGRGWDLQGAHTKGYNVDSIGIAFIGTFTQLTPPERQLNASMLIINEGIRLNKLVKDYRLYGARQLVASESPGSALYEIIKKWPNWSKSL